MMFDHVFFSLSVLMVVVVVLVVMSVCGGERHASNSSSRILVPTVLRGQVAKGRRGEYVIRVEGICNKKASGVFTLTLFLCLLSGYFPALCAASLCVQSLDGM